MRRLTLFALLFVSTTVAAQAPADKPRLWKDDTGTFQIQATLVRVDGDNVVLKKEGGVEVKVPLSRLSEADRAYLTDLKKEVAQPDAASNDKSAPLVVIPYQAAGQKFLFPALVYRTDKAQALLVAEATNAAGLLQEDAIPRIGTTASAVWLTSGKANKAELKVVYARRNYGHWIFSGPADKLPASWESRPQPELPKREAKLSIVGYQIDYSGTFTSATLPAVFDQALRKEKADDTPQFTVRASAPLKFRPAAILDAQGETIGIVGLGLSKPDRADFSDVHASTLPKNYSWERIQPGATRLHPVSGDQKKVVWRFVMEIISPTKPVEKPRLAIVRVDERRPEKERAPSLADAQGVVQLDFKSDPLPESSKPWVRQGPGFYWADFEQPNTGPERSWQFQFEVTLNGEKLSNPYPSIGFSTSLNSDEAHAVVREIPGLNGQKLEVPVEKVGEAFQITSERTVPAYPVPLHKPEGAPQPVVKEQKLAGAIVTDEGLPYCRLTAAAPQDGGGWHTPRTMVADPDGKHLFLVDSKNVLHKVDWETLTSSISLKLPGYIYSLQVSQAGVLAGTINEVYQIDRETLELKGLFRTEALNLIAASPESKIAVVFCEQDAEANEIGPFLWVLDFERGKAAHRIQKTYDEKPFVTPLGSPFPDGNHRRLELQMTADGKYLFFQGKQLLRFRLNGSDLFLEEVYKSDEMREDVPVVISGDGKTGALAWNDISLFNPKKISERGAELKIDGTMISLGTDPAGKRFYAVTNLGAEPETGISRAALSVLTSTGEVVSSGKINGPYYKTMLVDPQGERVLLCGDNRYLLYDLKPGRLKK